MLNYFNPVAYTNLFCADSQRAGKFAGNGAQFEDTDKTEKHRQDPERRETHLRFKSFAATLVLLHCNWKGKQKNKVNTGLFS